MKEVIKKVKCEFEVVDKEDKAFTLNISDSEKIFIYDDELLEEVIDKKFNKQYRKLLYLVMDITENDDNDDENINMALLKIEDLKNILLSKYYKYISRELLNKYLKMLMLLDEKLTLPRSRGR